MMKYATRTLALSFAVAVLGAPAAAPAQDFIYWFTDDFDSYGNTTNFAQDNNNGWFGGWNSQPADQRRNGSGGDNWEITNGKFKPRSDTHCGQEYSGFLSTKSPSELDCAIGYDTWPGAPNSNNGVDAAEPEDNWIVKENALSLADPEFGMAFQFDNVDDDGIGMVFRFQDEKNFYMFQWAWRKGGKAGAHLWSVGCCEGGHAAPICNEGTVPAPLYPDRCTNPTEQDTPPGAPATGDQYIVGTMPTGAWVGQTGQEATWDGAQWTFDVPFRERIIGRAAGHGGWLYRVNNGVITELGSSEESYIQGQLYNVMIRGIQVTNPVDCPDPCIGATCRAPPMTCPAGGCHHITIWMDVDNDGFQDADKLIDMCDGDTAAILTGGAYGLWNYDNSAFTVDGFIAQEAPLPPTIDGSSVMVTADHLNGFLDMVASAKRGGFWTLTILEPDNMGMCDPMGTQVAQYITSSGIRDLDFTFPGLGPGDYCWTMMATNILGSDQVSGTSPVTILPRLAVTQPGATPSAADAVDYDFTTSAASTGTYEYSSGDCAGGGYALRVGLSGTQTLAQAWDQSALRLDASQTVEAWIYGEAATTGWSRILGKGALADQSINYGLYVHDSGAVNFSLGDGTSGCSAQSAAGAVSLTTWHHLAGRYDGTTLEAIVDGTVAASVSCSLTPNNDAADFIVGYDGESAAYQGLIAHAALYDSTLSNGQINSRVGLGPLVESTPPAGNVLIWHFRETPNQQVVWDSGTNGIHGFIGSDPRADANDAARWPSFAMTDASMGTTSHTGTVTGLSMGTTYCTRALGESNADTREAYSPLRVFTMQFDMTPPVVTAPPTVALECATPSGTSHSLTPATVTDNLDPAPTLRAYIGSVTPMNELLGPPYTHTFPFSTPGPTTTVIWEGTDFNGNQATDNQTVWVDDSTAPSVDAGMDLTVEATSPAGTPAMTSATVTDLCDASPATMDDAQATYPLGTTTVTYMATDAAGNGAVDTVDVTIVDTTGPTFDNDLGGCVLPDLNLNLTGCYTGPLPAPAATDNGFVSTSLTWYVDRTDTMGMPEAELSTSVEQYCEVDGTVAVTWRVEDPLTNSSCTASQNVVLGAGSFAAAIQGLSYDGTYSGASMMNASKFNNGDVTVAVSITGCADGRVQYAPSPATSMDELGGADPSEHIGTYSAEAEYTAVTVLAGCDTAGSADCFAVSPPPTCEFGIAGPVAFGIDTTPPLTDFSEIPVLGVTPSDSATYPRGFLGETIDLAAFEAFDTTAPIQSGIASVQVLIDKVDDPMGGPATTLELTLGTTAPALTAMTPIEKGPPMVTSFACDAGGMAVCPNATGDISLVELSTLDGGLREEHRVRIEVSDVAGNAVTENYYLYLNNYSDALDEALVKSMALVADPFNVLALSELEDADANLVIADSYLDLTFMATPYPYLEGSYVRAQYTIAAYDNAASLGIDTSPQREYIARAAWGDVRVYVDNLDTMAINAATYIANADSALADGLTERAALDWGDMIREVRDARDAVSLLYADYQAIRDSQAMADDDFVTYDPATSGWAYPGMLHEAATMQMAADANDMLLNSVKPEIQAALTDPGTTQQAPLNAIIAAIDIVQDCLRRLSMFNLNDDQFTDCYLQLDDMATTLDTVEISLVSTYRWQTAVALALFAMLDISLNLSPTALTWLLNDGLPAVYEDPAGWGMIDLDAGTAKTEYDAATNLLNSGDVLGAYDRFQANRCLIVTIYNKYYSVNTLTNNVSQDMMGNYDPVIDPTTVGCP